MLSALLPLTYVLNIQRRQIRVTHIRGSKFSIKFLTKRHHANSLARRWSRWRDRRRDRPPWPSKRSMPQLQEKHKRQIISLPLRRKWNVQTDWKQTFWEKHPRHLTLEWNLKKMKKKNPFALNDLVMIIVPAQRGAWFESNYPCPRSVLVRLSEENAPRYPAERLHDRPGNYSK